MVDPPGATSVTSGRTGVLVTAGVRQVYLTACLTSLSAARLGGVDVVCVVDTSDRGLSGVNRWLASRIARSVEVVRAPGWSQHRAMRAGLDALAGVGVETVIAVEEDFVLLPGHGIAAARRHASDPGVLQVVVCRQRWFEAEYRHASMAGYLVAARGARRDPAGRLRIDAFFTTNPHVARLDRLQEVLADVQLSDDYDFEQPIGAAAGRRGLTTLVQFGPRGAPAVLHIGAVTTTALRRRSASTPAAVVYAGVHARRTAVVAGRWWSRLRGSRRT